MEENKNRSKRIESIDLLRGLAMVLMALDHTRYFFHQGSAIYLPTDLDKTTFTLFLTRFITHICAPAFIFLAGTAAYLYGTNKKKKDLFTFLFTRGIWLIILGLVLNNFLWSFDLDFESIQLQVIWAIGFSMICLSVSIFFPKKVILAIGVIIVAGHNLLDGISMEGNSLKSVIWYILHQENVFQMGDLRMIRISYPVLPWIGVMMLGYCLGTLYKKEVLANRRRKWLLGTGIGSISLFFVLRILNIYGDPDQWIHYSNFTLTLMSFFNVTKYPASLDFILITLGPSMLILASTESIKNKFVDFLVVFGRVPLFYYFLHIFILHSLVVIIGGNWKEFIFNHKPFDSVPLGTYELNLWIIYLVWILLIFALYPISKWYMNYKVRHRDKWWLSYL
ncbi:MAG TPA: heparan-alpha-glucosaminide N-acetyltransferase domain-containing protein [Spirochaetota bacterium]|nr:heparan-alpha-glucosaminide N-acetyltransferase domain-containing protein [Spirochaetota bacterium]